MPLIRRGVNTTARAFARRCGFDVRRRHSTLGHVAARTVRDTEYYEQFEAAEPVFSPWKGHPDFEALFAGVEPHTLVSRDRCYILATLADYAAHLEGDLAECGVCRGGTGLLLCHVVAGRDRRLYLFDSFEGLPDTDPERDPWVERGDFAMRDEQAVRRLLADFEDFVELRKGWIPETFEGLEDRRYAFAHIDVDIYRSALDCCRYLYPRMVPGGVLVFDEYGFATTTGEKEAVDEFFADKPESPIALPTGQAMVVKLPAEAAL